MIIKRSYYAGMTNYTGASIENILDHINGWKKNTIEAIAKLNEQKNTVESQSNEFNNPQKIINYIDYFIDLFKRYTCEFDRLINELPNGVTKAHIKLVEYICVSVEINDDHCVNFQKECETSEDDIVFCDSIYATSRGLMWDFRDLENLKHRLLTFVGVKPKAGKKIEDKFQILLSAAQEQIDFDQWIEEASGTENYSIALIFIDIDNFKGLNTKYTEAVVDEAILQKFQKLLKNICRNRASAYRHGGEEFVIMLPNHNQNEALDFSEKLRSNIEKYEFQIDENQREKLTISGGLSVWPKHGKSLTDVIKAANNAEHVAKTKGKNCIIVASNYE